MGTSESSGESDNLGTLRKSNKNNKPRLTIGEALRERAKVPGSDIQEAWNHRSEKKKHFKQSVDFARFKKTIRKRVLNVDKKTILEVASASIARLKKRLSLLQTKKLAVLLLIPLLVLLTAGIRIGIHMYRSDSDKRVETEESPVTTNSESVQPSVKGQSARQGLPVFRTDNLEFPILMPRAKKQSDTEIVKISPPGNDIVYTFVDSIDGRVIQVSEQKVPANFINNQNEELSALAKGFQANEKFQIDEIEVYHGYSEKGPTQSLIFIKDGLLVFISAEGRFSEDVWVSYILSLELTL